MTPPRRPRVRDDVALRKGYHSPQLEVDVRLNTNESPWPPPPEFTDAVRSRLDEIEWNRYPDRMATALRQAIGDRYGCSGEEVFVANGSNEVLQTILLTFGGPGRVAAVFEPTYALHGHIARTTSTGLVEGARGPGFELDLDEVERMIDEESPDVLFLCSPNNPTGLVDSPAAVSQVLALVENREILVVVDEAYGQFARSSAVELIGDDVPLVVTRTFSKTWSLAALRLGYLLGPAWLVAELEKVVLPYHLDAVKQAAGLVALEYGEEMERRVASIIEERGRLHARLAALPVDFWPSDSSFILFRPRERDGEAVWQALVDRSILIRNCASWPGLDGCLRVTVGTPAENSRFVDALHDILVSGER